MNPGDTVSRYRILGRLGQGGMGVVYRAEDTRLNRPVALKFLPSESLAETDKQRFMNEARAAAAIRHPNVCPIYDVEEADGRVFIAMACLDGETLTRKLARGQLDIREAARIGAQIAAGLEAAHRLGIVHRDIKSGNVIVGEDGHVSILDFGLALRSGETRLTVDGGAIGTPAYMSPEQIAGKAIDFRTDIWSLGVLLFEMVTGSAPFRRDNQNATMYAIVHDDIPQVATLRPATPAEFRRLIEMALRKDPAKRCKSALDMAGELRRISGDSGGLPNLDAEVTRTIVADIPARGWRDKLSRIQALALLAFAIIVAGGLGFTFRPGRRPAPVANSVVQNDQHIAVLPFHVEGGDAETVALADGMVEVLTSALSDTALFHGKVTAVPSSEIRNRAINSPEKARKIYGVNLAISGSAKRGTQGVEFTLQLTDAVTLRPISTPRTVSYDTADPSKAKSLVVEAMAGMLNFELSPVERKAVVANDSAAPGAYKAYLEGRGLLARYDVPGNVSKAIAAFRRAIAEDSDYALAHAGLAEGLWRQLLDRQEKEVAQEALVHAERAVELAPGLAITHAILGQVYGTVGRQQEAIAHLRKAIEISPANAEAPRQLAQLLAAAGRLEEAEASYVAATKSRPTDWYGHLLLGIFYFSHERFGEAEKALRNAQALTPDNDRVYLNLGSLFVRQGLYAKAEKELQRGLQVSRNTNATLFAAMANVLFYQHRYAEAVAAAEAAIELDGSKSLFWGNLGVYYHLTPGNEGKAVMAFQKAVELAQKSLEASPDDYSARANLAEYKARAGDLKGAEEELKRIPESGQKPRGAQVVLVHELTGHRAEAIRATTTYITTAAAMRQIKDDPDLARLWADAAFQKAVPARLR